MLRNLRQDWREVRLNMSMTRNESTQAPQSAAKVIAVVNQKGGVGKTTTAINLSASLALAGQRTLLVDCDPQANTTGGLGLPWDLNRLSVYDLLTNETTAGAAILLTEIEQLSLLPSNKDLIGANFELMGQERREFRLRSKLQEVLGSYRFVVLDCPPSLDLLTLNSLVAADGLLVPMQAEYFALEGISELMSTLDRVSQAFNPGLSLEGVLLTMYDERTNLSQQVAANLKEFFGDKLLKTTIPRNIRLAEAPSHGKPVALYDPRSRGAEAYRELATELLVRNGVITPGKQKKPAQDAAKTSSKVRLWPYSK